MPDYKNAKIYKITNTVNDNIYIGSTTMKLYNRMTKHRYCARRLALDKGKLYKAMNRYGVENFEIKLIKDYPCDNKEELLAKEFKIIKKYIDKGTTLYNTTVENGKSSEETQPKLSKMRQGSNNSQYGKVGAANSSFNRGSISSRSGTKAAWLFQWYEDRQSRSKSFGIKKYGNDEAKSLAEEYRNKIYPIE